MDWAAVITEMYQQFRREEQRLMEIINGDQPYSYHLDAQARFQLAGVRVQIITLRQICDRMHIPQAELLIEEKKD